jgi:hypothetical protein
VFPAAVGRLNTVSHHHQLRSTQIVPDKCVWRGTRERERERRIGRRRGDRRGCSETRKRLQKQLEQQEPSLNMHTVSAFPSQSGRSTSVRTALHSSERCLMSLQPSPSSDMQLIHLHFSSHSSLSASDPIAFTGKSLSFDGPPSLDSTRFSLFDLSTTRLIVSSSSSSKTCTQLARSTVDVQNSFRSIILVPSPLPCVTTFVATFREYRFVEALVFNRIVRSISFAFEMPTMQAHLRAPFSLTLSTDKSRI